MKRREIFIELTSLLDVILIILFVILTQARTQTADALTEAAADRAAAEELRAELAARGDETDALREAAEAWRAETDALREEADAYRAETESLRRQLLSRDLVDANSLILTLSVPAREAIRLESGDGGVQTVSYDWENDNYARNALLAALRAQLGSAEGRTVFLVFQYDRAAIYRSEYDMIREVFNELKLDARQREMPLSVLELDTSGVNAP